MEETLTLTFSSANPCNTTLKSPSGDVVYRAVTEIKQDKINTYVRNAEDEVIAGLSWRDNVSDRVTVKGKPIVAFSQWLKRNHVPFKE